MASELVSDPFGSSDTEIVINNVYNVGIPPTFKSDGIRLGDGLISGSLTVNPGILIVSGSSTGSSELNFQQAGGSITSLAQSGSVYINNLGSGSVSASGNLFAKLELVDQPSFKPVIYDLNTGKFFVTSSVGGVGTVSITSVSDTSGQTGIDFTLSSGDLSGVASGLDTDDDVAFAQISASGNLFANLPDGFQNIATYNSQSGQLFFTSSAGLFAQIDTFKNTGQREGDSFITGSLFLSGSSGHLTASGNISASGVGKHFLGGDTFINGDITGSNELLIQKSSGEGTPAFGTSNVAVFQNNTSGQDASIAIIAADENKSQIHFGKHDDIDVGGIRYFHEDHSTVTPDSMHIRVNGAVAGIFSPVLTSKTGLRLGGDTNVPSNGSDILSIQGALGGHGLTVSSSVGTRIKFIRGATNNTQLFEYFTGATRNWSLGNAGEDDDNFYIYNTNSNVKFIELVNEGNSTHIHTNVTASGAISASRNLFASASLGFQNIATYNSESGEFFYTSSAGLASNLNTFKNTGQRSGDASITGSFIISGSESSSLNVLGEITSSGNISSSGIIQGFTGSFDYVKVTGNAEVDGDLTVGGTITAQEFHTEFVSSSIIFESGSTIFGNSADDTHTFSGSITASHNISASGLIFASASLGFQNIATYNSESGEFNYTSSLGLSGQLDTFKTTGQRSGDAAITGSFEVVGNISASGTGSFSDGRFMGKVGIGTNNPLPSASLHIKGNDVANFDSDNFTDLIIEDTDARMQLVSTNGGSNGSGIILTNVDGTTNNSWGIGAATTNQNSVLHIGFTTDTQDVSSYFHADLVIDTDGRLGIGNTAPPEKLTVTGNISASGRISLNEGASSTAGQGLRFRNRADLGLFEHGFDLGIMAPDSVQIHIDSNANDDDTRHFSIVKNHSTIASQTGLIFKVREDATVSIYSHLSASGNISASGKIFAGLDPAATSKLVYYNSTTGELTQEDASLALDAAGLLSSSNQIASDISGAFTSVSASIATNIATNTTNITNNTNAINTLNSSGLLSSSNQIASNISGAFTNVSASIATNIANNTSAINTLNSSGLLSSSNQIASNISGAFDSIAGTFLLNTTDTLTGDLTVTNNITASGNISASKIFLPIASEIDFGKDPTHATPLAQIKSTDENLDLQHLQGNFESGIRINTLGDIKFASVTNGNLDFNTDTKVLISSSGNVGIGINNPFLLLHVNGNARAENILIGNTAINTTPQADIHIKNSDNAIIRMEHEFNDNLAYDITTNSGSGFLIAEVGITDARFHIAQGTGNIGLGTLLPKKELEVIGDISASGKLFGGLSSAVSPKVVYYNTSTGELTQEDVAKSLSAAGLLSSSGQIASDISGAFTSTSASIAADIANIDAATADTFKQTGQRDGDSVITGSLFLSSSGHLTASGNISSSGAGNNIFGGPVIINAAANNLNLFEVQDTEQQNNFRVKIDTNQHTDVFIEKDGTEKIRFNTYHPTQIDNDHYEGAGGLILGSDVSSTSKSGFGLYVSAGPDSGSIYSSEKVFIGVGEATGSDNMLTVGGNISTTSHITASGDISASGLLFASSSVGNFSDIVVQDLNTGRFYTTSSAALNVTSPFTAAGISGSSNPLIGSVIFNTAITGAFTNVSASIAEDISVNTSNISDINTTINSLATAADVSGSFLLNTTDTLTGDLTVTGNISGSNISASGRLLVKDNSGNGTIFFGSASNVITIHDPGPGKNSLLSYGSVQVGNPGYTSHITASGGISASGTLHAGLSSGTTVDTVFYNTTTGELSHGTAPSSFTAAGITGSFTELSSSIAIDIANNSTLFTAAGITGSFTELSSSIATEIANIDTTDTFKQTGQRTGSAFISGSLTLEGPATPALIIKDTTNPEQISITQANSQATIDITGGSGTDNNLAITTDHRTNHVLINGGTGDIHLGGHIEIKGGGAGANSAAHVTASGNISASGDVIASNVFMPGGSKISFDDSLNGTDQFITGDDHSITIDGDDKIKLRADKTIEFQDLTGNEQVVINPVAGHITASGNISASGDEHILGGQLILPQTTTTIGTANLANASLLVGNTTTGIGIDNNEIVANNTLNISTLGSSNIVFRTNATEALTLNSSQNAIFKGNVSASGTLHAGLSSGTTANAVFYNTTTGELSQGASSVSGVTAADVSGSFLLNTDDTFTGTLTVAGDIDFSSNNSKLFFNNNSTSNKGITYKDSGNSERNALVFPGDNLVVLSNRASNGVVQIKANTSTAGDTGEVLVAEFQDDKVILDQSVSASKNDNILGRTTITNRPDANQPTLIVDRSNGDPSIKSTNSAGGNSFLIMDSDGSKVLINHYVTDHVGLASGGGNVIIGANATPGEKLEVRGNISASGTLFAGLSSGTTSDAVFYNTTTGELSHGTAATGGGVTAADVSGSFLLNTTDTLTGNLNVTNDITASNIIEAIGSSAKIRSVDTTQNYIVELVGEGGPKVNFGDTDSTTNSFMILGAFSSINQIDTKNRDFHLYSTNTTTGFYFDEDAGKFGIGTTAPHEKLEVVGNISASGYITLNQGANSTSGQGYRFRDRNDLGLFEHSFSLQLSAPNDVIINIDSNDNQPDTDGQFEVRKHGSNNIGTGTLLMKVDQTGGITASNTINLQNVVNAGTDTDKFLVLDSDGNVDFRTGANVLDDIGGIDKVRFSILSDAVTSTIDDDGGGTAKFHFTGSNGIKIVGTPANSRVEWQLDYEGTNNFIDSASDLEGTAIATGDTIVYHDADDNNIKKGLISDLPFLSSGDNLGNHTATEALNMAGFSISQSKNIEIEDSLIHHSDVNTKITFSTDQIDLIAGGITMLSLDEAGQDIIHFGKGANASNIDIDFRVETQNNDNAFFIEGSTTRIGIGTNDPSNRFEMRHGGSDGNDGFMIVRNDSDTDEDELLGGIGFDSITGNVPSRVREASSYIAAFAAEDHSAGDKGGYLTFGTAPIDQNEDTTSSERMRIDSDGRVYINETSNFPGSGAHLYVKGAISASTNLFLGDVTANLNASQHNKILMLDSAIGSQEVQTRTSAEIVTEAGGLQGLLVNGDNVSSQLFGATNPFVGIDFNGGNNIVVTNNGTQNFVGSATFNAALLDIDFVPGQVKAGVYFNNNAALGPYFMETPTTNFTYNANGVGILRVGNDIIAFASDKRLKENIVEISDPIEKIKKLRGVTYDWKDKALDLGFQTDRQYNEIGLIAQELEKVIPQAVTRAPFDNEENENIYLSGNRIDGETEPYKTIKMDKVVPLLIEAIKDQQKQIDELKELITKKIK